jgi:hypothetical protein
MCGSWVAHEAPMILPAGPSLFWWDRCLLHHELPAALVWGMRHVLLQSLTYSMFVMCVAAGPHVPGHQPQGEPAGPTQYCT